MNDAIVSVAASDDRAEMDRILGTGCGGFRNNGENWRNTEEGITSYMSVFLALMALVLILSKYLHESPKVATYLPEVGMTILLGITASFLIWMCAPFAFNNQIIVGQNFDSELASDVRDGLLSFSPNVVLSALIPPIIFNSGYHVNRKLFFYHIRAILLYACVGTFLAAFATAALLQVSVSYNLTGGFNPQFSELLAFGALISSTDPISTLAIFQAKKVDPQLFYLVFGESVLNGGVAVVLFETFADIIKNEAVGKGPKGGALMALTVAVDFLINFFGSALLGFVSGLGMAALLKFVDMTAHRLLELALFSMVIFWPYCVADSLSLSPIVTILFTGIFARRYAEPNLSADTRSEADLLLRVMAHLSQCAIFLELGLSVFGLGLSSFDDFYILFVLWALLACVLARACNVYPVTLLANIWTSLEKRRAKDKVAAEDVKSEQTLVGARPRSDCNKARSKSLPRITINLSQTDDGAGSVDWERTIAETMSYASMNTNMTTTYQNASADLSIPLNTAHMMWFSGLRGAVGYACAKSFPNSYGNRMAFVNITMAIVLVTVFVMGCTTKPFLEYLDIERDVDEEDYTTKKLGGTRKRGWLNLLDEKFLRPCVVRNYKCKEERDAERERLAQRDRLVRQVSQRLMTPRNITPTASGAMEGGTGLEIPPIGTPLSSASFSDSVKDLIQRESLEVSAENHDRLVREIGLHVIACGMKKDAAQSVYDFGRDM